MADVGVESIAGACPTSSRFIQLVNEAARRLHRKGDWHGTVLPIQVCTRNGCVVFPRYVQSVRKVNVCGAHLPVENLWFRFIDPVSCGRSWEFSWKSQLGAEPSLTNQGLTPVYSDVAGDGRLIRAYPRTTQDIGKKIRIFGVDNGNQPLRTNNGDGTWSEGVAIVLVQPFGSTSVYVRRIDRVLKDITQGQVLLYGYNAALDQLEDIAIYDPGETSPAYQKWRVQVPRGNCCGPTGIVNCCPLVSIVALVKLAFIPARVPSDIILPGNIDALKDQIQSVKARESRDLQEAALFERSAINELARELEDNSPDEQFAVENGIFGSGVTFRNQAF